MEVINVKGVSKEYKNTGKVLDNIKTINIMPNITKEITEEF